MTETHRSAEEHCTCDLRTRLLGDGCRFCSPELAEAYADGKKAAHEAFGDTAELLRRANRE